MPKSGFADRRRRTERVEGRSKTHDPYDVATPRYTRQLLALAFSAALGAVTLLALLATDLPWTWRAAGAAAAVVAPIIAVNAWFSSRWAWSQWRKARLYPGLLNVKRHLEGELATLHGVAILAAGLSPLDVEGVYEEDGRVLIVVASGDGGAIQHGDTLLVVDTLERKLVGRARVVALEPSRCEAEVHQPLDALFWGFVRQEIRSYRRRLPPEAAVFREADDLARRQALAGLMQEVEQ
jgi:hypothetical protein